RFSRDWSSDVCSSDLAAGLGIFRTRAPIGRLVAGDPGAVADLLTLVARERDLLGFAVVQQIDLVVAGPDMVAVLAVELDLDGVQIGRASWREGAHSQV